MEPSTVGYGSGCNGIGLIAFTAAPVSSLASAWMADLSSLADCAWLSGAQLDAAYGYGCPLSDASFPGTGSTPESAAVWLTFLYKTYYTK